MDKTTIFKFGVNFSNLANTRNGWFNLLTRIIQQTSVTNVIKVLDYSTETGGVDRFILKI